MIVLCSIWTSRSYADSADMVAQGTKTAREWSLKKPAPPSPNWDECNKGKGDGKGFRESNDTLAPLSEMSYNPRSCANVCLGPCPPENPCRVDWLHHHRMHLQDASFSATWAHGGPAATARLHFIAGRVEVTTLFLSLTLPAGKGRVSL